MRAHPPLLVVFVLLSACAAMDEDGGDPDTHPIAAQPSPTAPRSMLKIVPPELLAPTDELDVGNPTATAGEGTIVYMNRMGGTYSPGSNDARNNRSSIIESSVSVPAWNVSDAMWSQVMSCMRDQFAPFDVLITDVDPGATPHYESVVAGSPTDIGMPDGVGGVSPFTANCGVIDNSIVFTFAEVLPQDPQIICEVAAQEFAHSIGLDHQYMCEDPMTYLNGCGAKSFQNVSSACGEYSARDCRMEGQYDCGRTTQNSFQLLSARLGPRQDDVIPPQLAILEPGDGQLVGSGFAVIADASDDSGVMSVEMRIDGIAIDTLTEAPYEFQAPGDLDLGTHVIELVARDGSSETTESIAVELVEGGPGGDGSGDGSGDGDSDGDGIPDRGNGTVVGGCSAAGAGATSQWAWLLVFALGAGRRRRQR